MRRRDLAKIICIHCGGDLVSATEEEILGNSVIDCIRCCARFPVIRYVPRLLGEDLLYDCMAFYGDIVESNDELRRFSVNLSSLCKTRAGKTNLKKTQKSFTYEWEMWSRLPEFAENHFLEVMEKPESFFEGKTGWDPAIGMGRDILNALKAVGPDGFMIGSDISYSVDIAHDRCANFSNYLIVQADLYSTFLRDDFLDFAYMIGLIQHLAEPGRGVYEVYRKVKRGGYFVGTVYEKPRSLEMKTVVALIRLMRIATTRLPLPVVLWISRLFALPSYLFFKLPRSVLERSKYVAEMDEQYPTHQTQKGKPDFNLLVHNWFDHFTPPITGFYSDSEILDLLRDSPLEGIELRHGIFRGFKI